MPTLTPPANPRLTPVVITPQSASRRRDAALDPLSTTMIVEASPLSSSESTQRSNIPGGASYVSTTTAVTDLHPTSSVPAHDGHAVHHRRLRIRRAAQPRRHRTADRHAPRPAGADGEGVRRAGDVARPARSSRRAADRGDGAG